MPRPIVILIATIALSGTAYADAVTEVVVRPDVRFQPLNPARGDASPRAGALWGDIRQDVASGALIVFGDGFSSPPHIHNITYRAVVISGAVHNDDPTAENLWMGPGSFWTQPAGESHITAAAPGSEATAFLEIQQGPYLVQPSDAGFDNGERPVNIDARNMVWLHPADVTWVDPAESSNAAEDVKIAFLWGSPQEGHSNGTMLKLPSGSRGHLRGNDSWLRAVVIQGEVARRAAGDSSSQNLAPGSYFGATERSAQEIECVAEAECLVYVSTTGRYDFGR